MKTDVAGIIERAGRYVRLSISGQTIPPQPLPGHPLQLSDRLILLRWRAQRGQASAALELANLRPSLWGQALDVQQDREQEQGARCTALVVQNYADRLALLTREFRWLPAVDLPWLHLGQSGPPGWVSNATDPDPDTSEVETVPGEFRSMLAAYALSLDIWDS